MVALITLSINTGFIKLHCIINTLIPKKRGDNMALQKDNELKKGSRSRKGHRAWWEVRCDKHGSAGEKAATASQRVVKVSTPANKFERRDRGCPICFHTRMREVQNV